MANDPLGIDWTPQRQPVPNVGAGVAHIGELLDAFANQRMQVAQLRQQKAIHDAQLAEQNRHNVADEGLNRDQLSELSGYHTATTEAQRAVAEAAANQKRGDDYRALVKDHQAGLINDNAFAAGLRSLGMTPGGDGAPAAAPAAPPASGPPQRSIPAGGPATMPIEPPPFNPDETKTPAQAPNAPPSAKEVESQQYMDNVYYPQLDDRLRANNDPWTASEDRTTANIDPEAVAFGGINSANGAMRALNGGDHAWWARGGSPAVAGAPGALMDASAPTPQLAPSAVPTMPAGPSAALDAFGYDRGSVARGHAEFGKRLSGALGPVLNTPYGQRALREVVAAQSLPGGFKTDADAVKEVLARATHYEDQANAEKRSRIIGAHTGTTEGFRGLTGLRGEIRLFLSENGLKELGKSYSEISKAADLIRSKSGAGQAMAVDGFVKAARGGTVTAAGLNYIASHMAGGMASLEDAFTKAEKGQYSDPSVREMTRAIAAAKGAILNDVEQKHQAFVDSFYTESYYPVKKNVESEEAAIFGQYGYKPKRDPNAPGLLATGKPMKGGRGRVNSAPAPSADALDAVGDDLAEHLTP